MSSTNYSQTFGGCSVTDIAVCSWACIWIYAVVEDAGTPIATPSVCW